MSTNPPSRERAPSLVRAMSRALWVAVSLSYLLMAVGGVIEFSVWSQILDHARIGIFDIRPLESNHAIRYALLLPTLELSDYLDVDLDYVFSVEVAVVMLLIPCFLDRARMDMTMDRRPWSWERFLLTAFYIVLSLFMNGRIAFGLLGVALLIFAKARWQSGGQGTILLVVEMTLALFLSSVSTGVFTVVFVSIMLWSLAQVLRRTSSRRRLWSAVVGSVFLLALVLPLAGAYATRNLEFHGGVSLEGAWNLLTHGVGNFFVETAEGSPLLFALLASVALGLIAASVAATFRYPALSPALSALTCALAGGLFGYSTLISGIPALTVLLLAGTVPLAARGARRPSVSAGTLPLPSTIPPHLSSPR